MFSGPSEALLRAAGTVSEKQLCSEGSTGGNRVYTRNSRRAKKLIPALSIPLWFLSWGRGRMDRTDWEEA